MSLALLCACGGSIDTTDEDDRRADLAEARGGGAVTANTPASPSGSPPPASTPVATPPASPPPAATPQASTPPASTPPASTPPASTSTVSFETDIWPIFNGQCGPCHTVANIIQNIGADDKDAAFEDAVEFKASIISEIEEGTMPQGTCSGPPGTAGCVSVAEFELIQDWVDGGAQP